jgi:hypothetical protein
MAFIDEGIGTDPRALAKILEGIGGVERLDGDAVFLAITGGMQLSRVPTVDLREFQLVHECEEVIVGRMQILQHYEQFDSRYKGMLPLKRVYVPETLQEIEE